MERQMDRGMDERMDGRMNDVCKCLVSPLQLNITHRRMTITKISPRPQNPAASAHLPGLVSPPVMLRYIYFYLLLATTQSNGCTQCRMLRVLSAVTMETLRHPSLLCLQVLTVASSGPADPEILPPGGADWSGEATEAVRSQRDGATPGSAAPGRLTSVWRGHGLVTETMPKVVFQLIFDTIVCLMM